VTLAVRSSVALSGLQGGFHVYPPGLRISAIEPTGPAAGMDLRWQPTDQGAQFVLFAEVGAPIPPADSTPPVPVLNVILEQAPDAPAPPVTYVSSERLFGSDNEGHEVPTCPVRLVVAPARICAGHDCDFNADGRVDVRDLVTMVHCWNHTGPCPPDSARFDCNGDSTFTLDDVFCCALRILERRACAGCPADTSHPRREDGIRVAFGTPVTTVAGIDVPLEIHGAERIGGIKLAFDYPDDRYEATSVEFPAWGDGDWLHLSEARDGQIVLGLVRLGTALALSPGEEVVNVLIHLALKPGQSPGGALAIAESQFSGPDGVRLDVPMAQGPLPLAGTGRLLLSAARPNPFTAATTFTLTLDRSSDVEVGIFDVGGRLVATLHRGRLAAGTREFTWNGVRAGGSAAPSGIYFYRAGANGQVVSRKTVLLRGN